MPDTTARRLAVVLVLAGLVGTAALAHAGSLVMQPLQVRHDASVVAPIYRGTPSGDFPAVVAIVITEADSSQGLCSGTLISPTIVLTAGHCLASDPQFATVYFLPDGVTVVGHPANRYAVHPDFNFAVAAFSDVAVLGLVDPVTDVAPLPLASGAPRAGTKNMIVGFGDDGAGDIGTKRVGAVRVKTCPRAIRRVGIGRGQLSTSICWKPKRRGNDTCPGDSGGPLLARGAVAGVTSGGYGVGSCPGLLSWDTSVLKVRAFIDQALAL